MWETKSDRLSRKDQAASGSRSLSKAVDRAEGCGPCPAGCISLRSIAGPGPGREGGGRGLVISFQTDTLRHQRHLLLCYFRICVVVHLTCALTWNHPRQRLETPDVRRGILLSKLRLASIRELVTRGIIQHFAIQSAGTWCELPRPQGERQTCAYVHEKLRHPLKIELTKGLPF